MRSRSDCSSWALLAVVALCMGGCRPRGAGTNLRVEVPKSDRDADLYVDGNYIGTLDAVEAGGADPLRLAPGVHRVEVRKPGRFPIQKTVEVDRAGPPEIVIEGELLEDPK